ncbi:glycosyltransferase family 4 protein [Erythrobacter sp. NE805]|uniref:glycosyltransferase family 4 protein n=1 Tax=Erythrobacter sp. NE805 TaxID=3389875 RepID=UPI00396B017F
MSTPTPGHVLMTTDAVGGVWHYACDLAAELARAGTRVTLAVLGPAPGAAQRGCLHDAAEITLVETGLPLDWLCADAPAAAASAQVLAEIARACGAELVHCNSPALAGAARFPVPVVAVAHGCIATWWEAAKPGAPLDPALRWHAEMMRRGLLAADAVVAPSVSFAATLQATYRLPRLPLVVHNGRPPAAPDLGAQRLNAALCAGRMWDPVKNAAVLDAAASLTDITVLAAGPTRGPNGEEARFAHAVALGELPGPDLADLLALQPIVVSPATFEPFGLAVLEAAAAGCALILSDIATFRELWDGAAVFVDPADPAALAAAIAEVHADPDRREALGAAARARSARFTPAATAEGMAAIYRSLVTRKEVAA